MATAPEDEGFRVTDRRRKTDEEEAASVASMPQQPTEPPREPAVHDASERQPAADTAPEATSAPSERDLSGLFIMLASSAAFALGEAPDPASGQVRRDLAQAAALIDLLVLLREKTEGHRTAEESNILEELIYDLQLRYVAATRRSGPSPGRAQG